MEDCTWRSFLTSSLREAWKDELFTDLEIMADDGLVKVHKIILASVSPYFRALLSNDLIESRSNILNLRGVNIKTLQTTLDYVYSGRAFLTSDNCSDVLALADYFQIESLKKLCSSFLKKYMNPSNCLMIYELAVLHRSYDLEHYAFQMAQKDCSKVLRDSSFLTLHPNTLLKLLQQPVLKIATEDELFEGIINWYSLDCSKRAAWLPTLLQHIKCQQLSPMKKIELKDHFEAFTQSESIFKEALTTYKQPFRHRKQEELLIAIGGEGKGPIYNHAECFTAGYCHSWKCSFPSLTDVDEANENVIPSMAFCRSYAATATLDNTIYLMGGLNSECFLDSCEFYDITKNRWESLPSLPKPAHGASSSFLEGSLYVLGGKTSLHYENYVLSLDSTNKKWISQPAMSVARAHFGAAVLNDRLYAIGGLTGEKYCGKLISRTLSSCERYDPFTQTWSPIASLGHARAYHGVAVLNDSLYAIGGYDGNIWLNSVEKYNPLSNQWTSVYPMVTSRSSFGVTVSHGRIYCMGGFSGDTILNSVEKYNPRTDMWHCVQSMQLRRMGIAAATLKIPRDEVVRSSRQKEL